MKSQHAQLSEGWEMKKLSELGKVQTGTTPSTKNKEYYGDYISFIKPPHFKKDGTIDYQNLGLSSKGLEKGRLIKENSILMVCIGATIGKTSITTIPVSCNQQINAFTPNEGLNPKFFYYLLSSSLFFKKVMKLSSQATLPMINKSKWQSIEVAYPKSLPEQKQIVTLLDEAFAAIDQAKANVEKNIANAKELFQSKLNEIFSQKGEGWKERSLGEVCEGFQYGSSSKSMLEGKIPVLRMGNLQNLGIDWLKLKYSNDDKEIEKYLLKNGDVLFNRTNSPELVGKSAIYRNETPAIFAGYLIRVRGKERVIDNQYLNFYLNCTKTRDYGFSVMSSSVNQANINASKLKNYKVRFPEITKQITLVKELKNLQSKLEKVNSKYVINLQNLEALKKSLLQKAFAGELTQTETLA